MLLIAVAFSSLSFKQRVNDNPLPLFYKKGVYHLHSTFSDGRGGIEAISRAAEKQDLDFVILTDHGRPNRQASAATAWNHDVLLVGASEVRSMPGTWPRPGTASRYIFPPEPQQAINEVRRDGGVTFMAHLWIAPPWTDWQVHGFTGIEVMSLYQIARKNMLVGITFFPLQYLFNSDYALTSLISFPQKELRLGPLRPHRQILGIYALDSHASCR